MSIWQKEYRIKTKDVDMFRKLKLSALLELLQEASIAHTEELGFPRQTTLDKGYLWVILQMYFHIIRMPVYDDVITIESWPGKMQHMLFPRYYRILSREKEVMAEGSMMWTLVDAKDRKVAFPEKHGVIIPETETGYEVPLPRLFGKEETTYENVYTVPYSFCDLNGHMNNTKYFDILMDHLDDPGKSFSEIHAAYSSEVLYKQKMILSWMQDQEHAYFQMQKEKPCFKAKIIY